VKFEDLPSKGGEGQFEGMEEVGDWRPGAVTYTPLPTNGLSIQLCKPLPWPDIPMVLHNPLRQLHDLDRASPQFHDQLSCFLRGNEYQNVFPNLKSEDLAWLVEYLDCVSL